jgi:hypothetical protein
MNERQPGEDLGIGWGVAEDPQTDAMGVNNARDWQDANTTEGVDDAGEAQEEARDDRDDASGQGRTTPADG